MYNNVFYYSVLCPIGGIETWLYNIGKKYGSTHDILVLYSRADPAQLSRLKRVVRTKKFDGQPIQCKRAFLCYDCAQILDHIQAEEYFLVVHGDYKALGVTPPLRPKINRYIGVSQVVCDGFQELSGLPIELCYNPQMPIKPRKVLRLISATRFSPEKCKARFETFAKALDKAGIPFTWDIFTDDSVPIDHPSIFWRKRRLDVVDFIADADYLVQLSDTEGEPYSLNEALSVGTPVIVTDFPAAREMGVQNGVNGWILPMDMQELPLDSIVKGLKKFKYTPPKDRWDELLVPGEGTYLQEIAGTVAVECVSAYQDLQLDAMIQEGMTYHVSRERADVLINAGVAVEVPDA